MMEADGERQEVGTEPAGVGASSPDLVFETVYDYGGETDGLTVVIIDAIADAMGVSPTEIVPKISESVDPDALERILRPLPDGTERNGRLTFYLLEFRITVESDGTVRIFEGSS